MAVETSPIWIPPRAERQLQERAIQEAIATRRNLILQDGRAYRIVDIQDDDTQLAKSIQGARAKGQPYRVNPSLYSSGMYAGVKDINGALYQTYRMLRQIPRRNPVIAAIHERRIMQAMRHLKKPDYEGDNGLMIKMRNRTGTPSVAAKKRIKQIEDIVFRGGVVTPHPRTGELAVWNAEGSQRAPGLQATMRAFLRDSLELDAAALIIEEGMDSSRYPVVWWGPGDGALIRRTIGPDTYKIAVDGGSIMSAPYVPTIQKGQEIEYVEVNPNGIGIQREFTWKQLAYFVRRPRSDQYIQGYGYAEQEQLIDIIIGIIYGIRYNTEFFDTNHIPPGILALKGNYDDAALADIRMQMRMMVGGVNQFWHLPIMTTNSPTENANEVAAFTPIRQEVGDGMYSKEWLLFCAAVGCALYGMDPNEINFVAFGQSSNAMNQSDPESKILYANESGFEPFMTQIGHFLDTSVVNRIDDDFEVSFPGINRQDEATKEASSTYRMAGGMSTPNMELARQDQRPIQDPIDSDLWAECLKKAGGKVDDPDDRDELQAATAKLYTDQGGQFAKWPDAPVGSPGALQIWMEEHGMGQQQGAPPGSGDPGDQQQEEEAQPGANDPEGPDTHVADMGAGLARRPPPAAPPQSDQQAFEKSIIEVVVRKEPPR